MHIAKYFRILNEFVQWARLEIRLNSSISFWVKQVSRAETNSGLGYTVLKHTAELFHIIENITKILRFILLTKIIFHNVSLQFMKIPSSIIKNFTENREPKAEHARFELERFWSNKTLTFLELFR